MSNLDGRAAWILLTVMALAAVIGFEQGLVRSLAAVREAGPAASSGGVDADREPVPRAQPLSSSPLDEAAVRQIARQEAEAALARSRPKKAEPVASGDDAADPPDAAGPAPLAVPPVAAPAASPAPG